MNKFISKMFNVFRGSNKDIEQLHSRAKKLQALSKWFVYSAGALLLLIIAFAIYNTSPRHFFSIKGISFSQQASNYDSITLGADDNIIFNTLDTSQVKIILNKVSDSVFISLKKPTYVWVNDVNINKIAFPQGSTLRIGNNTYSPDVILRKLDSLRNKSSGKLNDYNIRNVLRYIHEFNEQDSINFSFFHYEDERWYLVLLDRSISLNGKETVLTRSIPLKNDALKLQFFRVELSLSELGEVTSILPVSTEWGANHVLFKRENLPDAGVVWSAWFSHHLAFAISENTTEAIEHQNENLKGIYIKSDEILPNSRTFYVNRFSDLFAGNLFMCNGIDSFSYYHANKHSDTTVTRNSFLSHNLLISSIAKPHIKIICEQLNVSRWYLTIPFLIIVIVHLLLIFIWNNISRSYSHNDFKEYSNALGDSYFQNNFSLLFKCSGIILSLKLAISINAAFTYPYLSHFFFTSIVTCITIPIVLFIVNFCFLVMNNPTEQILNKFHVIFIPISIAAIYTFIFAFYFGPFYESYLNAYNLSITDWLSDFLLRSNDIYKAKFGNIILVNVFLCLLSLMFFILMYFINPKSKIRWFKKFNSNPDRRSSFISVRDIFCIVFLFILLCLVLVATFGKGIPFSSFVLIISHLLFIYDRKPGWIIPLAALLLGITTAVFMNGFQKMVWPLLNYPIISLLFILIIIFLYRRGVSYLSLIIGFGIIFLLALGKGDPGSLISFVAPACIILSIVAAFLIKKGAGNYIRISFRNSKTESLFNTLLFGMVFYILFIIVITIFNSQSKSLYAEGRNEQRIKVYSEEKEYKKRGVKSSERVLEFFAIEKRLMYRSLENVGDIQLLRDEEPLHPVLSKGKNMTITNDLNPTILAGTGKIWFIIILILVWIGLLLSTLSLLIDFAPFKSQGENQMNRTFRITTNGIIRFTSCLLIVSGSMWMLLSLYGLLPFTGRLIYGLGIDSVTDVLEFIFFFGLMGIFGGKLNYNIEKTILNPSIFRRRQKKYN